MYISKNLPHVVSIPTLDDESDEDLVPKITESRSLRGPQKLSYQHQRYQESVK